jgi:hypothetical protein
MKNKKQCEDEGVGVRREERIRKCKERAAF